MNQTNRGHRSILGRLADKAMLEQGLLPEFSRNALRELAQLSEPASINGDAIHDLRDLLWCSIDNDDSRDLDQLTVAEALPGDNVKISVAVADVDALVKDRSAINAHAEQNTTSVYTAARIYPMLPEKLSTDLTSLNQNEDRLAILVEMTVAADGNILGSAVYPARVRNKAKLAYNSVAAWLEGTGPVPDAIPAVEGLADNLKLQDSVAQRLHNLRHVHGALSLETIEARPVFDGDTLSALERDEPNRAKSIIEEFMVAANGVTARFLETKKFPSVRRVVRVPKRWDRIVELAGAHGFALPVDPDSKALDEFLVKQKAADPVRFPDLSLAVIKLLGSGEYVTDFPEDGAVPGHFGLAVKDYNHSTAPNRRYPDLITQRLLKAALTGSGVPYGRERLNELAQHCTEAEDAAAKVERRVQKSAAALLLESRIGEKFDGLVTGAADKGTWVRLVDIPVEGKLVQGFQGIDVGDRVRVQLIDTDVERGFIDFALVAELKHAGANPG
ncbi:MAG TPA: RNB domain-containing ribonuclease [Anaerolineales bacterium]